MNTKIVIASVAGVLALLFGGMFWLSRPQAQPEVLATSVGQLSPDQYAYDFGAISMAKGKVSKKFTLANSDSVPATITKLFTSCMCTQAQLQVGDKKWGPYGMVGHGYIPNIAAEIAPGQNGEVEVIFDPAAHGPAGVGQIERQVTVEQNGQSPLTLTIQATVTP